VDLVFPRNNTVYQPVYPFPIVYAIHNFSKVWKYQPTMSWLLIEINLETQQKLSYSEGVVGFDPKKTHLSWAPPPDTFLAINSSSNPSKSNQSSWILQYNFNINALDCAGAENLPGYVYFNTSNISGVMPNLKAFGDCAPTIGAISIETQLQTNDTCVQPSSPQPNPVPCAYSVDQNTVDQVAKEMIKVTRCENVTWPNGTGIGNQCQFGKTIGSESNVLRWNSAAMGLSVIMMALILTSG
jgi:hypothetical protein